MAYTNFTNCTEQEYLDIIYSQDDKNRIKIWFNNVELTDAGEYCESLSGTNRILPSDGSKRLSLDNFVAREYTLVLRDLPNNAPTITDQVRISIGTLVNSANDTWEDVPIGIFNIQDAPTTDKNKITIKLRDNRVKFDFGYNAQPLIEEQGGRATYKQILTDICTKAGVTCDVSSFAGQNISVAIYDNKITATTYVSYIAEQAGAIPVITRAGHLDFIYLNNLTTWRIPLSIVEKYEIGTPFTIERVVYESGIVKYQTSSDETKGTLYLDAANPYVSSQAQVTSILTLLNGVTIDSATTGKILGNPAMDAWDLIEIYDDEDVNETTILKTLANNEYTFNGVHRQTFDTEIGKAESKENVTVRSEATAQRWAKTEIDNLNSTVSITAGRVDDLEESVEMLRADIDTNVVVIAVNETNEPLETKTIDVGYAISYLGETQSNILPTIIYPDSTHSPQYGYTGITTNLTVDKKISFTVATGTEIQGEDNKYTFKWSKTVGTKTYEVTRTIIVSTVASDNEQNVVMSTTAPEDTSLLWYSTIENKLRRYVVNEWVLVNDFTSDIKDVSDDLDKLDKGVANYIKNGYKDYGYTTDVTFEKNRSTSTNNAYYELINGTYTAITRVVSGSTEYYQLNDGTRYNVGDKVPDNKIYQYYDFSGIQSQILINQKSVKASILATEQDITQQITTTTNYINAKTDGKTYYSNSTGTVYTGERTGNPHTLGLYEKKDDSYVVTNDTEFDNGLQGQITDIIDYVKFDATTSIKNPVTGTSHTGVVTIGKSTMDTQLRLAADVLFFDLKGQQVMYIATDQTGNTKLYIKDAEIAGDLSVVKSITVGNFGWKVDTSDNSLTFGKVK